MARIYYEARMINPKLQLAERERAAYIRGDADMAKFYGELLDYVAELEEAINQKDCEMEDEKVRLDVLKRKSSRTKSRQY
jgi:hypothetical protein